MVVLADTESFFETIWHYVPIGAGLAAGLAVLFVLYWLARKLLDIVATRGKAS